MVRALMLFYTTSYHCPRQGKETVSLFSVEKGFLQVEKTWMTEWSGICLLSGASCVNLLLKPSVIYIFGVTVCFLLSLLFTVNCSYLNPWSFPFVPQVGGCGGEGAGWFPVGTLNCRILFLNHNNDVNLYPIVFFYTKAKDGFTHLWQIFSNTNPTTFSLTGS